MGKSVARITKPPKIPPLRDGDRLTSEEFLRRYEADRTVVRAELLNGVVHINAQLVTANGQETIMPPISAEGHGDPHFGIIQWLGAYTLATPGVRGSAPSSVQASTRDNVPEPDVHVRILPEFGGRTKTDAKGFLKGVPELIVEVSNTSAALDLGAKRAVYLAEGVDEYLVWRTAHGVVDWFSLKGTKYVELVPDKAGVIRSHVFPGLWLNVPSLVAMDMAKVVETAQLGLASPEHAAFVAKLHATAKRKKK